MTDSALLIGTIVQELAQRRGVSVSDLLAAMDRTDVTDAGEIDPSVPLLKAWSKDDKEAIRRMPKEHLRYLVDMYYTQQEYRKRAAGQVRASDESDEPNLVLEMVQDGFANLETRVKQALAVYVETDPAARWLSAQVGIGPVIAAGLLAHIDIAQAPNVGHIWNYAGLNPDIVWEKGQKRPWNAKLKTLSWHAGECFVKTSGRPNAFYGPLYARRKEYETARNERGGNAERAAQILTVKRFGDDTQAKGHLLTGKLPPAHIHAMAKRWTVKLFLSHLHEVMFFSSYGTMPPKSFAIERRFHSTYIAPPLSHLIPGLEAAQKALYAQAA